MALALHRLTTEMKCYCRCTYTQHLDKVLEEAAATFYPHIKFVRVSQYSYYARKKYAMKYFPVNYKMMSYFENFNALCFFCSNYHGSLLWNIVKVGLLS